MITKDANRITELQISQTTAQDSVHPVSLRSRVSSLALESLRLREVVFNAWTISYPQAFTFCPRSLKCQPMVKNKEYFEIKIEELQCVGRWAAVCAERALSIYESIESEDARPRNAINGIKDFSTNGKRTNHLRKLALDAYRASLETRNQAASAAAQSASLAAASAYTHPFKDVKQARHILGAAAYSAFAIELSNGSDSKIGDLEIELAIDQAPHEIVVLLREMPAQEVGKKRIDQLFYQLDRGLRNRLG